MKKTVFDLTRKDQGRGARASSGAPGKAARRRVLGGEGVLDLLSFGKMNLFNVSKRIETLMWNLRKMFPNVDWYLASVYHMIEQRNDSKIIRPGATRIGVEDRPYVNVAKR